MVSTHLKNISQTGSFPQIGVKIKHIWNHHLYKLNFTTSFFKSWPGLIFPNGFSRFQPCFKVTKMGPNEVTTWRTWQMGFWSNSWSKWFFFIDMLRSNNSLSSNSSSSSAMKYLIRSSGCFAAVRSSSNPAAGSCGVLSATPPGIRG